MERDRAGAILLTYDLGREMAKNILMGIPTVRRLRTRRPRTLIETDNVDAVLSRNAFLGLNLLLEYIGSVQGKSVCEIGAGDYLTSGLSMLAAGTTKYSVIDRFPGDYTGESAKHWYCEIQRNWERFYPSIAWSEGLHAEHFPDHYGDRIEIIREPIEQASTESLFDIICSFQVGEHVSDLHSFADVHQRLLKPGGVGLHRVDFGPHDVWSYYRDPATFLRFSDRTWKLTGSNRGVPNRRRHHEFLDAFDRAGLNVEVLYTDNFDESSIDYERLHQKFQQMPKKSVLTGTAIYRLSRKSDREL